MTGDGEAEGVVRGKRDGGSLAPLVALGIGSELIYLLYFLGQFPLLRDYRHDTDLGTITAHGHGAFAVYMVVITVLFVLFGAAWWQLGRMGGVPGEGGQGGAPLGAHPTGGNGAVDGGREGLVLAVVLGFGVVFAVTLVFVYPITATDLFSYIAQSRVWVAHGQNPIFTAPDRFPHDRLMALADGYRGYGSPYGPLGIVLDAAPTVLFGGRLLANLVFLKGMYSAMALGSAYVAYRILRSVRPGLAVSGALLIVWNPLVLLEVSVNGHNDVAMMFFVLLGLLAVVEGRLLMGPVVLALACTVKYAAVFLVPLVLLYGMRRQGTRNDALFYVFSALAWSFAVVAVLFVPLWEGPGTISTLLSQTQRNVNSLSSVLSSIRTGTLAPDQSTAVIGWVLFLGVFMFALELCRGDAGSLLRACFLTMLGFLALAATNVEGWYLLWPVMLAAVVPFFPDRACAVLLGYGTELAVVVFGYVFVWLKLDLGAIPWLNALTYGMTFVPAVVLLVLLSRTTLGQALRPSSPQD